MRLNGRAIDAAKRAVMGREVASEAGQRDALELIVRTYLQERRRVWRRGQRVSPRPADALAARRRAREQSS